MKDLSHRISRLFSSRLLPRRLLLPQGEEGVQQLGHRDYVGGKWDEIGQLQLKFLVSRGLEPWHSLLDIGCGSLRLGCKAIPYLDGGNYYGIEKEESLINAGLEQEVSKALINAKQPRIMQTSDFNLAVLDRNIDFAIAHSLFTHLTKSEIDKCLLSILPRMNINAKLYASFFECNQPRFNPKYSHDHDYFCYTRSEMTNAGSKAGYRSKYIGEWGHPRGQMMIEYMKMK